MNARRFGLGLTAGLLLGVAIVASSGGFSSNPFSNTILARVTNAGSVPSATTAVSTTTTLSATTTTAVFPYSSNSSDLNSGVGKITTTTNTQSQVSGVPPTASPAYSSRIDSITQQPILSNTFILVPLLMAFLLGALLYRASVRRQSGPDQTGS